MNAPVGLRSQLGLSLIELMISITLGLIILVALLAVFVANNQSAQQTAATSQLQDNARAALDTLGRDLSMAGYWGGMFGTSNITPCDLGVVACPSGSPATSATGAIPSPANQPAPNETGTNIQWSFQLANRVEFADQLDGSGNGNASITTKYPTLDPSALQPGSDVVAMRRAAGQPAVDKAAANTTVTLSPYGFYLWSNGTLGSVIRATAGGTYANASDNTSYYKYVARLYYVRTYDHVDSTGVKDNIPSLCRLELCGSGLNTHGSSYADAATCGDGPANVSGFYTQCIAEGIESLQIKWGLNLTTPRTSKTDCMVDTYSSQPTAAQLSASGLTAQISVLVRSAFDGSYVDQKTYTLADYTMTPTSTNNHYHRRVYSTTVQLRNPNGDSGLCTH